MTSAPVTDWPLRLLLIGAMVALIALVFLGMWRGWRRRARKQRHIPAPSPMTIPIAGNPAIDDRSIVSGVYLGSVYAGRWLDRIVVHGLGVRSRVLVVVRDDAIDFDREGAPSFSISSTDLVAVRSDRGIAGRAYERGGIAVITWRLGEQVLDTGVRADRLSDQQALVELMSGLIAANAQGDERP